MDSLVINDYETLGAANRRMMLKLKMPVADFLGDCLVVDLVGGKLAQGRVPQSRLAQGKVAMDRPERGVPARHLVGIWFAVQVSIVQSLEEARGVLGDQQDFYSLVSSYGTKRMKQYTVQWS